MEWVSPLTFAVSASSCWMPRVGLCFCSIHLACSFLWPVCFCFPVFSRFAAEFLVFRSAMPYAVSAENSLTRNSPRPLSLSPYSLWILAEIFFFASEGKVSEPPLPRDCSTVAASVWLEPVPIVVGGDGSSGHGVPVWCCEFVIRYLGYFLWGVCLWQLWATGTSLIRVTVMAAVSTMQNLIYVIRIHSQKCDSHLCYWRNREGLCLTAGPTTRRLTS